MAPRRRLVWLAVVAGVAAACSATDDAPAGAGGNGAAAGGTGGGGVPASSSTTGGSGGLLDPSGVGGGGGILQNPCGTGCGDVELCDADHLGFDDDCNGQIDEVCPCGQGQVHFCFMGDSSYHDKPGCHDGIESCSELGVWGGCYGGVHATDECYANDVSQCHAITAVPFQLVDLETGTGDFSANAVPGSETWTVSCPAGVNPCPAVSGSSPPDDFKPLQSGEYTVVYTKELQAGGTDTCSYPLFVGAPGLRIELEWEHDLGGSGVDLDLHLHEPESTLPWVFDGFGAPQECAWSNCTVKDFANPGVGTPIWFSNVAVPPDPVNWYLDPTFEKNSCYFAPRGVGQEWQDLAAGCHSPRLDLDDVSCDPTVTDPEAFDFCAPENINVDFPPTEQWLRLGVHYFWNSQLGYDVHPRIKVFCDGQLAAELGAQGYYDPGAPVTFHPEDGDASILSGRLFWMVADVAFRKKEMCTTTSCVVQPLYADPVAKTPLFVPESDAKSSVGPAYAPPP